MRRKREHSKAWQIATSIASCKWLKRLFPLTQKYIKTMKMLMEGRLPWNGLSIQEIEFSRTKAATWLHITGSAKLFTQRIIE